MSFEHQGLNKDRDNILDEKRRVMLSSRPGRLAGRSVESGF